MSNIKVKIISDTVCPWCYVGKKRLEKAITTYKTSHPNASFSITWAPYYLDPTAPKAGVEKRERMKQKFGAERATMMTERLTRLGKADGIDFKPGGRTGNTRDSHRLIELGKTKGLDVQTRVVEKLFEGYFEQEQDITSKDFLLQAGVDAGLEKTLVQKWLDSDEGGKEVDEEVEKASGHINGVPNFTIQGQYKVDGAQDPEEFLRIFNRIAAEDN